MSNPASNGPLEPKGWAGSVRRQYYVASREASLALPETFVPVDHAIVGIVDAVEAVSTPKIPVDESAAEEGDR